MNPPALAGGRSVIGENTCDGKKKAWEILAEDAPMHIMDIPQMKRKKDYDHWKDEIYGYIRRVEALTGNTVTPEKLHDAIVLLNNKRKALPHSSMLLRRVSSVISAGSKRRMANPPHWDVPRLT